MVLVCLCVVPAVQLDCLKMSLHHKCLGHDRIYMYVTTMGGTQADAPIVNVVMLVTVLIHALRTFVCLQCLGTHS